jgi:hypothetical protein
MSWVAIGIGAGVGTLGGGIAANQVGEDPLKGALLGATAGGLGGWAFAPASTAGAAGAAGAGASGAAATPALTSFGAASGGGAALAPATASFAPAAGAAATPAATSAGVAATQMPAWATTQAAPSAFAGLGKSIASGVAVNGAMAGGNALLNPKPDTLTPGQPPQMQPLKPLEFNRINFGGQRA